MTVVAAGINGKMSEFSAALGLLQLKHIDQAIARRKMIDFAKSVGKIPTFKSAKAGRIVQTIQTVFRQLQCGILL